MTTVYEWPLVADSPPPQSPVNDPSYDLTPFTPPALFQSAMETMNSPPSFSNTQLHKRPIVAHIELSQIDGTYLQNSFSPLDLFQDIENNAQSPLFFPYPPLTPAIFPTAQPQLFTSAATDAEAPLSPLPISPYVAQQIEPQHLLITWEDGTWSPRPASEPPIAAQPTAQPRLESASAPPVLSTAVEPPAKKPRLMTNPRVWTKAEDQKLIKLVQQVGRKWSKMLANFPECNRDQIVYRYDKVLNKKG